MVGKTETRRRKRRPGFVDRASGQPARNLPNPNRRIFQLDVPDPDRGSASNKPTGRDSAGKLAEIHFRHHRAARQRTKELKGPGTWPDIILNKRRRELRLLRRCWIDAGRSTLEIDSIRGSDATMTAKVHPHGRSWRDPHWSDNAHPATRGDATKMRKRAARNVSTTLRQPSVEFKLGFLEFSSVD